MSSPERPETTTDEPEAMRPIPDGGLHQSMPEWLRRPPAWRDLPKKDAADALPDTDGSSSKAAADLPEPNVSPIDPRSLVDVTDLPQWLQEIAARGSAAPAPPVMTESSQPEEDDMTEPEKRLESEPRRDRDVAFEPTDKKAWEAPEHETKTYGGKPPQGMNQSLILGLGLLVAAIILILLIAFVF